MNPFRVDIVNLLNVISDYETQIEYQQAVPYVGVPDELVCQWFDDLYHPTAEIFIAAFDEDEKQLLYKFNEIFSEYADNLPDTIEDLHRSPHWQKVARSAKKILSKMGMLGIELNYESKP